MEVGNFSLKSCLPFDFPNLYCEISPPEEDPRACHALRFIVSEINRTLPSPIAALTPPV
jgi:hypothetical protein